MTKKTSDTPETKTARLNLRTAQVGLLVALLSVILWIADLTRKTSAQERRLVDLENTREDLEVRAALKELPANVRHEIALISAPADWRPVLQAPRTLEHKPSNPNDSPQRLSLKDLTRCKVFDEGDDALYTLHAIILARGAKYGAMRLAGSIKELPIRVAYESITWDPASVDALSKPTSEAVRNQKAKLKQIQSFLIEYGEELVEAEILAP